MRKESCVSGTLLIPRSRAAAINGGAFTLTGTEAPELIGGARVTANYFRVFGISPAIGRGFLDSDDVPGAPRVVIANHRVWQTRFAGDPAFVGRTLRLEDESYTVIGVLPPSFDTRDGDEDLWAPLQLSTEQLNNNNGSYLRLVARLAPAVTLAQASDAATASIKRVAERSNRKATVGTVVHRYIDGVIGGLRDRLLVLFGAVGFGLLIACVNVANLLLARGSVRARELAIRSALGAGRGRLIRQLLAESLVLSLGAAASHHLTSGQRGCCCRKCGTVIPRSSRARTHRSSTRRRGRPVYSAPRSSPLSRSKAGSSAHALHRKGARWRMTSAFPWRFATHRRATSRRWGCRCGAVAISRARTTCERRTSW